MSEEYRFDNDDPEAATQMRLLSELLDAETQAVLGKVGVAPGWRCWDIGGGGGSVAAWLANVVGPEARVLASDMKPRHLRAKGNVDVLAHDVRTDALPEGPFDLIHARLVFMHLGARERILERLLPALKPGGTLMLSDWDVDRGEIVKTAPDENSRRALTKFHETLLELLANTGVELGWAARSHEVMRKAGLVDVTTYEHEELWRGGESGGLLYRTCSLQLDLHFKQFGMTQEELDTVRQAAVDPRLEVASYRLVTSTGRRPS